MSSELFIERMNIGECLVPTPFQLTGDQSIVRIDPIILSVRACRFKPCMFKRILQLLLLLNTLLAIVIHGGQGRLDTEGLQPVENLLCDRAIDTHTAKGDAGASSHVVRGSSTNVALRWAALATVGNFELAPAARAAEKA